MVEGQPHSIKLDSRWLQ